MLFLFFVYDDFSPSYDVLNVLRNFERVRKYFLFLLSSVYNIILLHFFNY